MRSQEFKRTVVFLSLSVSLLIGCQDHRVPITTEIDSATIISGVYKVTRAMYLGSVVASYPPDSLFIRRLDSNSVQADFKPAYGVPHSEQWILNKVSQDTIQISGGSVYLWANGQIDKSDPVATLYLRYTKQ